MEIQSADDSLYLPTLERMVRRMVQNTCIVPLNVCFMTVGQVHEAVVCVPGCEGKLTPVHVRSVGLGGTVSIGYNCTGCASQAAVFETSSKYELGDTTEVSMAMQVAFIIAGSTHTTYYKALKHTLGIDAVPWQNFQSTIRRL